MSLEKDIQSLSTTPYKRARDATDNRPELRLLSQSDPCLCDKSAVHQGPGLSNRNTMEHNLKEQEKQVDNATDMSLEMEGDFGFSAHRRPLDGTKADGLLS